MSNVRRSKMRKLVRFVGPLLLWFAAVWLVNKSGLALVIDQRTGEKYCVDRLAQYLGVEQFGPTSNYVGLISLCISLVLPLAGMLVLLWPLLVNVAARRKARE